MKLAGLTASFKGCTPFFVHQERKIGPVCLTYPKSVNRICSLAALSRSVFGF